MENYIITGVLLIIIAAAIVYIIKAKKSGKKCIGCPYGSTCSKNISNSSCCCGDQKYN
ncbi:MAG: FeoB-associated Cys-rich membrane protein [Clostridia bacterium]|nr:FeoB-associated Cys-rich membrane protein [Clostridia bacterium]